MLVYLNMLIEKKRKEIRSPRAPDRVLPGSSYELSVMHGVRYAVHIDCTAITVRVMVYPNSSFKRHSDRKEYYRHFLFPSLLVSVARVFVQLLRQLQQRPGVLGRP